MRAPSNRRAFVIGYAAATPLGATFARSWERAAAGEAGFRRVTRCVVETPCNVVGEIPDWDPAKLDFASGREVHQWNAAFVLLTMTVCRDALRDAGLEMSGTVGPRTACLIGSSLNGHDAYRVAVEGLAQSGPNRVSAFLLPNLCANVPRARPACCSASPDRCSRRRARAPPATTPSASARG